MFRNTAIHHTNWPLRRIKPAHWRPHSKNDSTAGWQGKDMVKEIAAGTSTRVPKILGEHHHTLNTMILTTTTAEVDTTAAPVPGENLGTGESLGTGGRHWSTRDPSRREVARDPTKGAKGEAQAPEDKGAWWIPARRHVSEWKTRALTTQIAEGHTGTQSRKTTLISKTASSCLLAPQFWNQN